ncbi:hypothetical protein DIPPA_03538 [Diplonema papillatum]|nr:hypothetical protein DIPPA_03538 [Diplonema papillatum]
MSAGAYMPAPPSGMGVPYGGSPYSGVGQASYTAGGGPSTMVDNLGYVRAQPDPPMPDLTSADQRLQQEIRSFQAMNAALMDDLQLFTSHIGTTRTEQTTIDEVCELFQLIVSILQSDPNVGRLKLLLFDCVQEGAPGVFNVLFNYLKADLVYAPGITTPEEVKRAFAKLRNTTLKTLSKVITLASFDHYPSVPETAEVSHLCSRAVVSNRGVEMLMGVVCAGVQVAEEAKISAVECLFAFVIRNSSGKQAVVDTHNSIEYLTTALRTEPSPMVRNYAAAIIRELANTHANHVIHSEFPEAVVDLVRTDSSADVRVLSIETLDVVLKADNSYITRYPLKQQLADVVLALLERDTNKEVADITCRLLSTIFTIEGRQINAINHKDMPLEQLPVTLTMHWINKAGYRAMLHNASSQAGAKVSGAASAAFRHLVQFAPWQCQLGHRIMENWSTMGILLKTLQKQAKPDDVEVQIPLIELSIALGLLFAQSPHTRSAVHNELSRFPAWLPTLRSRFIDHLNRAALNYYSDIEIFDVTGSLVNSMQGIQWNDTGSGPPQAKKASIRNIFAQQEERLAESVHPARSQMLPPVSTAYDDHETMKQKMMRLTFVIIVYAIHITLSPGQVPPTSQSQNMAGEPFSGAGPPSLAVSPQYAQQPATATASSSSATGSESPVVGQHQRPPQAMQAPYQSPAMQMSSHPQQMPHYDPNMMPYMPPNEASPAFPPYAQTSVRHPPQPQPPAGFGRPPQTYTPSRPSAREEGPRAVMRQIGTAYDVMLEARAANPSADASLTRAGRTGRGIPPPYNANSTLASHATRSARNDPMFPTAGGAIRSHSPGAMSTGRPAHDAELRQTYSKFDNALRLTIHFAQYFNRKVEKKSTYKATPDGYMIRQTHIANPWTPIVKKNRLKSWSVKDLKEGDLFYFQIPFNELSTDALEQVLSRARKHLTNAKKMFLITPQKAKGRRWFLFDVLNNIVPRVQDVLLELIKLLQQHGEENVKFPLFMFREQEMQEGERFIHPGNLLDIVDQIKFYFAQSPNDLIGVNSNYIKDLDERMKALASREFTGYEDDLSSTSTSEISSDDSSDNEAAAKPKFDGGAHGAVQPRAAAAHDSDDESD